MHNCSAVRVDNVVDLRVASTPRAIEHNPAIKHHSVSYGDIKAVDNGKIDLAAYSAIRCVSYYETRDMSKRVLMAGYIFPVLLVIFGILTMFLTVSLLGLCWAIVWRRIHQKMYTFSLPPKGGW